ncbi:DNA (cytosine-5-)-methyltransferase [Chryseobacterium indologenes]|uniref:DNA (cytosine-5-)-methyltransferase n=1 Tax=Chryseobacterium indologenes TaxID=253 RepID=UPI001024040C|nr:DNA (cytosine-5-)-methyltransferase [Chryseobacterium indologenes]VFA41319.1 Modification methylase HpaII [Chryseobacterium indologenes]
MESIKIGELDNKEYVASLVGNTAEEKAVLTHYLHNYHNGVAKHYEEKALIVINNIVNHRKKFSEKTTVKSAVTELLAEVENVPFTTPKSYSFKFIDLFAGIGGFRIAMQNSGGRCIYTSEWNKDAQITYKENFGEVPFGDISDKSIKQYIPDSFDILCAGFPCQAFSIAGYQKGFSDTRGTLFFDIEKVIETHRPKVVFLENVKNLVSHDKGNTFRVICEILEEKLKYRIFTKVLNSMTHGNVPQNRERIFIVAFDPEQVENYADFQFPEQIPLTKTIHDFLEEGKQEDKYYYKETHQYYPELEKTMTKTDTVYQWRRVYVRENKSNVCPTLTANMGAGGHNVPLIKDEYGIRKLTPKECFAFQGYPMDKYILPNIADSKLYMQAGNSVTTTLVERISREIVKVL